MFWIHGGGNTTGAADGFYDGSLLAARHQVVVVALNYRLGPFGWFSHPALISESGEAGAASGNFGTLDLIAGLRWVEDNIEYFGGDAGSVTVFGESAGGTNVVSLLLSPAARDLFHRAIVQSGSTRSSSVASAQNYLDAAEPGHAFSAREVVLRLLIHDGSASDRASAREFADGLAGDEIAEYLRSKSSVEIIEAYRDGPEQLSIDLPSVIRDGQLLPTEPALDVMAAAGRYNTVPVILGANRDEAKLWLSQDERHVDTYLRVITRLKDEANYQLVSGAHSEMRRVNAVHAPANALSAVQGPSVFAYRFDWDEEPVFLGADYGVILGAGHGLEIPFVFGHFRFGGPRVERLIFNEANLAGRLFVSEAMMSYWAEFAYGGAPGRGRDGRLAEWQPWAGEGAATGALLVIDTPAGGGIRMSRERLSRDGVIAGIDRAARLAQAQKCEIFLDLFGDTEGWSEEAYFAMGRVGCREHPPAGTGPE
jgi:para-nitrobenzyl esterase